MQLNSLPMTRNALPIYSAKYSAVSWSIVFIGLSGGCANPCRGPPTVCADGVGRIAAAASPLQTKALPATPQIVAASVSDAVRSENSHGPWHRRVAAGRRRRFGRSLFYLLFASNRAAEMALMPLSENTKEFLLQVHSVDERHLPSEFSRCPIRNRLARPVHVPRPCLRPDSEPIWPSAERIKCGQWFRRRR